MTSRLDATFESIVDVMTPYIVMKDFTSETSKRIEKFLQKQISKKTCDG